MILFLSVLLALVPLLGIVDRVVRFDHHRGRPLHVPDPSGDVGHRGCECSARSAQATLPRFRGAKRSSSAAIPTVSGRLTQRGKVESVQFYESGVGEPNKSVVSLGDGGTASRLLILEGDMRNALPVGQKVEVTFRKESGHNVLVNVDYP